MHETRSYEDKTNGGMTAMATMEAALMQRGYTKMEAHKQATAIASEGGLTRRARRMRARLGIQY